MVWKWKIKLANCGGGGAGAAQRICCKPTTTTRSDTVGVIGPAECSPGRTTATLLTRSPGALLSVAWRRHCSGSRFGRSAAARTTSRLGSTHTHTSDLSPRGSDGFIVRGVARIPARRADFRDAAAGVKRPRETTTTRKLSLKDNDPTLLSPVDCVHATLPPREALITILSRLHLP